MYLQRAKSLRWSNEIPGEIIHITSKKPGIRGHKQLSQDKGEKVFKMTLLDSLLQPQTEPKNVKWGLLFLF